MPPHAQTELPPFIEAAIPEPSQRPMDHRHTPGCPKCSTWAHTSNAFGIKSRQVRQFASVKMYRCCRAGRRYGWRCRLRPNAACRAPAGGVARRASVDARPGLLVLALPASRADRPRAQSCVSRRQCRPGRGRRLSGFARPTTCGDNHRHFGDAGSPRRRHLAVAGDDGPGLVNRGRRGPSPARGDLRHLLGAVGRRAVSVQHQNGHQPTLHMARRPGRARYCHRG